MPLRDSDRPRMAALTRGAAVFSILVGCSSPPRPKPLKPAPEPEARGDKLRDLAIARSGSCAVRTDRRVACWDHWGSAFGMEASDAEDDALANLIPGLENVQMIAVPSGYLAVERGLAIADGNLFAVGELFREDTEEEEDSDGSDDDDDDDDPAEDEPKNQPAVALVGLEPATDVIAYAEHKSCALTVSGEVRCWFSPLVNEADSDTVNIGSAELVTKSATQIISGNSHACALLEGGTVTCWGSDDEDQLGRKPPEEEAEDEDSEEDIYSDATDDSEDEPEPFTAEPVVDLEDVIHLDAGEATTCAVHSDGRVSCWGRMLGGSDKTLVALSRYLPRGVAGIDDAAVVGVGDDHACVATKAGRVLCWGDNVWGQLGDGTTLARSTPRQVPGIDDAVALRVNDHSSCALRRDGTAVCWGSNRFGQLQPDLRRHDPKPVTVEAPSPRRVFAFANSTCVEGEEPGLRCLGQYRGRKIGARERGRLAALEVELPVTTRQLIGSDSRPCALGTDGTLRCWSHYVPSWSRKKRKAPKLDIVGSSMRKVRTHKSMYCALVSGDTVSCWGRANIDHLGDGKTRRSKTPVAVSGIQGAKNLFFRPTGEACAIFAHGPPLCWGRIRKDLDRSDPARTAPVALDDGADVVDVIIASPKVCRHHRDGRLSCATTVRAQPKWRSMGRFTRVVAGSAHLCALGRDRRVSCWGRGDRVGGGSSKVVAEPRLVEGLEDVVELTASYAHTCARLESGAIKCWGDNDNSQLGRVPLWALTTPIPLRLDLP